MKISQHDLDAVVQVLAKMIVNNVQISNHFVMQNRTLQEFGVLLVNMNKMEEPGVADVQLAQDAPSKIEALQAIIKAMVKNDPPIGEPPLKSP